MDYEILPFPSERGIVVDAGFAGSRRHIIYGLIEVDVSRARELLRGAKTKRGNRLSFTAFIVACFSKAVEANPMVQAFLDWRHRLVIFHDVDVVTMIEPEAGAVAIPHVIRAANRKTVGEISDEIRSIQAKPARSEQRGGLIALGSRMPRFVRLAFYWILKKNPHWFKRLEGTVVLSSVGMFGKGGGWGLSFLPHHNLGLLVGGIAQKPGVHEETIEIRDYLSLTISFDHDIIDGAPAARFAKTLKELLESAAGLEEVITG